MQGYYLQLPEPVLFVVSKRRKSDVAVITVATTTVLLQSPTSLRPCFLLLVISYHATVNTTDQTAPSNYSPPCSCRSLDYGHRLRLYVCSITSQPPRISPSCVPLPPFPPVSTSSFKSVSYNQPSISSRSHGSISAHNLQISLAFLDVPCRGIVSGVSYVTAFANCITQL